MNRTKTNGSKRPTPEIGLLMECDDEEPSPAQKAFYDKARKSYLDFNLQIDEYNRKKDGKVVVENVGNVMLEYLLLPDNSRKKSTKMTQLDSDAAVEKNQITSPVTVNSTSTPAKTKHRGKASVSTIICSPNKPITVVQRKLTESDSLLSNCAILPSVKHLRRKDPNSPKEKDGISEATSVGGLLYGTARRVNAPCLLGEGDAEIILPKHSGKTYPSLMYNVKPKLNPRAGNLSVAQSDRSVLDGQVKGFLMLPAGKFCEWLLQQGLIRKVQYCTVHMTSDRKPVKLTLVHSSNEASNFIFSGGYVWFGDCCKTSLLVSVFYGSIFEGSQHPPSVILKLIYHWACQTNILNILQWVKVNTLYVRNIFSLLRAVCVLSMQKKFKQLGGNGHKVELGIIHVRNKSNSGKNVGLRVNCEIVGVLDPVKKRVRLRAIMPGKSFYDQLAMFLDSAIHRSSIICCNHSVDALQLIRNGFKNIEQEEMANKTITTYLRESVMKMFPTSVVVTSTIIIQQFLDELSWREEWGPNSMAAFTYMIKHLSDYTVINNEVGILTRLSAVSANPFKEYDLASRLPPVYVNPGRKRWIPAALAESNSKKKRPNMLSIDESISYEWWPFKKIDFSNDFSNKVLEALQVPGFISVDGYYYGTLEKNTVHPEIIKHFLLKCPLCHYAFRNSVNLMTHLILHFQKFPTMTGPLVDLRQCPYCFVGFGTCRDLKNHLVSHNLQDSLKRRACMICECRFVTRSEFICHMQQYHEAKELPYHCTVCGFRTSSYKLIIAHFKQECQRHMCLFCPYCLKTVDAVRDGSISKWNIGLFVTHIRRHYTIDESACNRCRLRFVNYSLLEHHLNHDHLSLENNPDVVPFVATNSTVMPDPDTVALPPIPQVAKPEKSEGINSVIANPVKLVDAIGQFCLECEGIIDAEHFRSQFKCHYCPYTSNCEQAAVEHYKLRHDLTRPRTLLCKTPKIDKNLSCPCGFKSSGDRLAHHMVKCQGSETPDELTVLNTVGLVRKSPEPVEWDNDEVLITQNAQSFIEIVSVESLTTSEFEKKYVLKSPGDVEVYMSSEQDDMFENEEREIIEVEDCEKPTEESMKIGEKMDSAVPEKLEDVMLVPEIFIDDDVNFESSLGDGEKEKEAESFEGTEMAKDVLGDCEMIEIESKNSEPMADESHTETENESESSQVLENAGLPDETKIAALTDETVLNVAMGENESENTELIYKKPESIEVMDIDQERTELMDINQERTDLMEIDQEINEVSERDQEKSEVVENAQERSDFVGIEQERNEMVEIAQERSEMAEIAQERSEVVEISTEKSDVVGMEQERNEVVGMTQERSEMVEIAQERSEIVEIAQERSDVVGMEQERNKVIEPEISQVMDNKPESVELTDVEEINHKSEVTETTGMPKEKLEVTDNIQFKSQSIALDEKNKSILSTDESTETETSIPIPGCDQPESIQLQDPPNVKETETDFESTNIDKTKDGTVETKNDKDVSPSATFPSIPEKQGNTENISEIIPEAIKNDKESCLIEELDTIMHTTESADFNSDFIEPSSNN